MGRLRHTTGMGKTVFQPRKTSTLIDINLAEPEIVERLAELPVLAETGRDTTDEGLHF